MEKIKNKAKGEGGMLSDFVLKLMAIIFAVIIWFAMSMTKFPTVTKTITKVPVDFSMKDSTAESKGLSVVNYKDLSVDVEIKGMNYEIGAYTANDLVATVDLDDVTKAGTYKLEIDVRSSHAADNCSVLSVTPATVEVKFDQKDTRKFPITVSAPNLSAKDGFTLKESGATPSEIEIQGAANDLDKLDKVVALYNDSKELDDDFNATTDRIIYYDADGNILEGSGFTTSLESVDINFVVYKKVEVQLEAGFANIPIGFDISTLPYSLSVNTIQVITPQLDAAETEKTYLDDISMYDITKGKTFKTEVSSLLANGEINQSGVDQIEVSFDLSDYATKEMTLPFKNIEVVNAPPGKTVTVDTEQISGIVMTGPTAQIKKLKESDLKAVIDLSDLGDVTANGSFSHEVIVYSEKYNTMWNVGTHEAVVTVSDPVSTSSATSSAAAKNSSSQ